MAIKLRYILMCDEVRQENNGKFLIIGLYTPDMSVPQIPFVLPSLTFFVGLETEVPGNLQVRFSVNHLDTGQDIAQGMGAIGIPRPGLGVFPLRMGNLPIPNTGTYIFKLVIEGENEPIIASFNVGIAPPQHLATRGT